LYIPHEKHWRWAKHSVCTELIVMFSVHLERRIIWVLIQFKFINFALMIERVSVK
jgi:hypothetical protein